MSKYEKDLKEIKDTNALNALSGARGNWDFRRVKSYTITIFCINYKRFVINEGY